MQETIKAIGFPALLVALLFTLTANPVGAQDVDFSCMSYKVWSKSHVSDRFRDFDIVIYNRCPGAVYWSMCIERVDPWTHQVVETHIPTGYVEAEKKARVNLHLMQASDKPRFNNRFQEFYVDIGYAIDTAATSQCLASACETQKSGLRKQLAENESAWEQAEKTLANRLREECPTTGWNDETDSECQAGVRADLQPKLDLLAEHDRELREQMAAVDPERCTVYSGELVDG